MRLKVEQCCCGCSLRTGTILIAFYYIVESLVILAVLSLGLYLINHDFNSTAQMLNETGWADKGRGQISESLFREYVSGLTIMFSFYMIYSVLSLLLNLMLLVAVQKEKLRLIYIWIITHVISLVITVVNLLTNIFMSILNPEERAGTIGSSLISIVLTFYFLVVVSSYYQKLKDRPNTITAQASPVFLYFDNQSFPPPYSEVHSPWPQQK